MHINICTFVPVSTFLCKVRHKMLIFWTISCVKATLRVLAIKGAERPRNNLSSSSLALTQAFYPASFLHHQHLSDFYVEVNKFGADQLFTSTASHVHANTITMLFRLYWDCGIAQIGPLEGSDSSAQSFNIMRDYLLLTWKISQTWSGRSGNASDSDPIEQHFCCC